MIKSLSDFYNIEECHFDHTTNFNIESQTAFKTTTMESIKKLDYCKTKPCINGRCQNVNFHEYSCTCEYGYVGRNCENILRQCELLRPCLNGGTCENFHGSYKCDCRYGFTGENCSKSKFFRNITLLVYLTFNSSIHIFLFIYFPLDALQLSKVNWKIRVKSKRASHEMMDVY